ncbi:MAG: DNA-binding MarR family transcriptional regulator [Bacteriovoracaceae bacterium]|jgi:DNA-binding MarR family transcriptional regulator
MKREEFEQLKESSIGHSLIKAGRLYTDYSFTVLKESIGWGELKPSHLQLFAYIPFEGITVVDLATKMKISKQAVSVLVNDLIEAKVFLKKSHPTDKRSFLITFNEKGDRNIFKGMKLLKELDDELELIVGKKNTKLVQSSLLKIIGALTK